MIKHFHQCFMPTNYGYNSQHAVQDFLVRSWYVIPLLKPIRLQSATPVVLWPWTFWTQRSSWLPNNASQSVNSDTSPVTDRLQSRPPCLGEKMPWCTEASPYSTVCKHAGESEGFTSCRGSAVQHPELHISCPCADEAEQADSPETWQLPTAGDAASLITTWWYKARKRRLAFCLFPVFFAYVSSLGILLLFLCSPSPYALHTDCATL